MRRRLRGGATGDDRRARGIPPGWVTVGTRTAAASSGWHRKPSRLLEKGHPEMSLVAEEPRPTTVVVGRRGGRPGPVRAMGRIAGAALLVALAVVLLPATPAHACSCVSRSTGTVFRESPEVLVGAPVDVAEHEPDGAAFGQRRSYRIEVREALKGQVPAEIEVWTGAGGGDCGVVLELGEEVVLAPFVDQDGRRTISICGGVLPIEEARAVPRSAPVATGHGPPAFFVAGAFGPSWLAVLDAEGRPLGSAGDGLDAGSFASAAMVLCDEGRGLATVRFPGLTGGAVGPPVTFARYETATLASEWETPTTEISFAGLGPSIGCTPDGGIRVAGVLGDRLLGGGGGGGGGERIGGPVLVALAQRGGVTTHRLDGSIDGGVDPRDGSVVTVDGEPDDPRSWRVVRRSGQPLPAAGDELATLVAPPTEGRRQVVAVVVDHLGRIAVAHGPRGGLGAEIDRISTFLPDGTPIADIDPGIPASPVESVRFGVDGDLTAVFQSGGRTLAASIRVDGSDRREVTLAAPTSTVVARGGFALVGLAAPVFHGLQDPEALVVQDRAGTELARPFGSVGALGAIAIPADVAIEVTAPPVRPAVGAPPSVIPLASGAVEHSVSTTTIGASPALLGGAVLVALVVAAAGFLVARSRRRSALDAPGT